MRLLKSLLLAILGLCASIGLAQNVPAPQIPLSGNVGAIGFPILNSGTFQMPADANVTFSISNVNTSAVSIKITSAVSLTATRTISYPAGRFQLNVENATTGGQSLSVCGPSGACVTVPNDTAHYTPAMNDGTNYITTSAGGSSGAIVSSPSGNQAITQPSGTSLTSNSLNLSQQSQSMNTNYFPANCYQQNVPNYNATHFDMSCSSVSLTNTFPGFDVGTDDITNQLWTTITGNLTNITDLGSGIVSGGGGAITKVGIGDVHPYYPRTYGYGGCIAGADECEESAGFNGGETSGQWAGTITAGGSQALTVKATCTSDCGNQGVGRYFTEVKATPYTSFITAYADVGDGVTPSALTVNDAVAVSTAWGTLASTLSTAPPLVPSDPSTYQVQTFNVNILSGAFAVGNLVCFGSTFIEQARISAVGSVSGGVQSITVPMRLSHSSGGWIMANGACGSAIVATANIVNGLSFPQPVLGSTDAHTLRSIGFAAGFPTAFILGNISLLTITGVTISRTSNVVSFNPTTLSQQEGFLSQGTLTIRSATTTSLNGPCTSSHISSDGTQIQCTQSGGDVTDTSGTGVITIGDTGYGNSRFALLDMAEVVDVRDLTQPAGSEINGTWHLEANNGTWPTSGAVNEYHHYSGQFTGLHLGQSQYNPLTPNQNSGIYFTSMGTYGFGCCNPNSSSMAVLWNSTPTSFYAGSGGTQIAPNGITLRGEDNVQIFNEYMPQPGGIAYYAGTTTPTTLGLADPAYYFYTYIQPANGGQHQEIYKPATASVGEALFNSSGQLNINKTPTQFQVQMTNGTQSSTVTQTPTSLSSTVPITASTGSSALGAGTTINSTQICLVDGTNCPNTLPLAATTTLSTATSDTVTLTGVTSSSICSLTQVTNSTPPLATAPTYAVSTNTVTITHAATVALGAVESVVCFVPNNP